MLNSMKYKNTRDLQPEVSCDHHLNMKSRPRCCQWERKPSCTPLQSMRAATWGCSKGFRKEEGPWGNGNWDVIWFVICGLCLGWMGFPGGEGNGTPLQYSCLENPMDGGAWKAAVHGVAEGRTRLSDFTFTFHFHALEKEMETHSSILAWEITWTEETSGIWSMGSQRVRHD